MGALLQSWKEKPIFCLSWGGSRRGPASCIASVRYPSEQTPLSESCNYEKPSWEDNDITLPRGRENREINTALGQGREGVLGESLKYLKVGEAQRAHRLKKKPDGCLLNSLPSSARL